MTYRLSTEYLVCRLFTDYITYRLSTEYMVRVYRHRGAWTNGPLQGRSIQRAPHSYFEVGVGKPAWTSLLPTIYSNTVGPLQHGLLY